MFSSRNAADDQGVMTPPMRPYAPSPTIQNGPGRLPLDSSVASSEHAQATLSCVLPAHRALMYVKQYLESTITCIGSTYFPSVR